MTILRRLRIADTADRLALVASGACLLHCLALPLLFAALPALSHVLALSEAFHLWMVAAAIPTSTFALLAGARGRLGPLLFVGFVGLALLAIGATIAGETAYEVPVTVLGALILSFAHVLNWRRRHGIASQRAAARMRRADG